jgi:iron complex transport system ATP-binding protein
MPSEPALCAEGIDAGYLRYRALAGVSVDLRPGDATAIIGPNGAGKSTLLKVLAGVLRPSRGNVSLDGLPLSTFDRRTVARKIAVVPQKLDIGFGLRAFDVVMLGRTPYIGFLGAPSQEDRAAVERAIDETDTHAFVSRPFASLSGGEAQRVVLAMALAQETPYLLLDEPTVHLDLGQQWKLLERLMELRRARNVGVLAVVHDLTLAGLNFDRIILMDHGVVIADGTPSSVLSEENVHAAFGAPVRIWQDGPRVGVSLRPAAEHITPDLASPTAHNRNANSEL